MYLSFKDIYLKDSDTTTAKSVMSLNFSTSAWQHRSLMLPVRHEMLPNFQKYYPKIIKNKWLTLLTKSGFFRFCYITPTVHLPRRFLYSVIYHCVRLASIAIFQMNGAPQAASNKTRFLCSVNSLYKFDYSSNYTFKGHFYVSRFLSPFIALLVCESMWSSLSSSEIIIPTLLHLAHAYMHKTIWL